MRSLLVLPTGTHIDKQWAPFFLLINYTGNWSIRIRLCSCNDSLYFIVPAGNERLQSIANIVHSNSFSVTTDAVGRVLQ